MESRTRCTHTVYQQWRVCPLPPAHSELTPLAAPLSGGKDGPTCESEYWDDDTEEECGLFDLPYKDINPYVFEVSNDRNRLAGRIGSTPDATRTRPACCLVLGLSSVLFIHLPPCHHNCDPQFTRSSIRHGRTSSSRDSSCSGMACRQTSTLSACTSLRATTASTFGTLVRTAG